MWTTKSTKNLAGALTELGHPVLDRTVARMLRAQGFSLQANTKITERRQHEDRDAQFCYLAAQVADFSAAGQPVISVDAIKKELLVRAFKKRRPGIPADRAATRLSESYAPAARPDPRHRLDLRPRPPRGR